MRRFGLALALVTAGCGGDSEAGEPIPTSRFESVVSTNGDVDQVLHDVCDVAHPAASAPSFTPPATTSPIAASGGRWTWINFWATWCHPCLEEMPVLQSALANGPFALRFVSADANDEELVRYRREHSFTTDSPRLTDLGVMGAMLTSLGFRGVSSLPVHVLLDPAGKVRCVRAGLVEARHIDRILGALGTQVAPAIR